MSLRSILGRSGRVQKAASIKGPGAKRASPSKSGSRKNQKRSALGGEEDGDDLFDDKLDDCGLVTALATDLNLRDSAQAIRHIQAHMFSPIPDRAAGMNSAKIAETLNYRKRLPPIVTVSHVQTLLSAPTAVEREIAELARSGFLRKIVVARRGDIGETLMLSADLDTMIVDDPQLSPTVKKNFQAFLKAQPVTQTVHRSALPEAEISELFNAGFLTAHHVGTAAHSALSSTMSLYARPEDKTTLLSLETVSRQPAGTVGAAGGVGAVIMAGGSGGRSGTALPVSATELRLAIPGNGAFLKLVAAALQHLVALLAKSRFREAPESALRDRWDGGIAKDDARYTAKRSRGEFVGILPGQTRKWQQFRGLAFDWVLQEAVGSGLVEVFETNSVGHAVRAV